MLNQAESDLIYEALRTLFLIMIPFLISVTATGLISAIFQASLGAREQAITYGFSFIAVVITGYLFFENAFNLVTELAIMCFK
jgi:flagellar biosynthesis protein FliQ